MVNITDTHCHLYSSKFEMDRSQVILDAKGQGIGKILLPNIDLNSIEPMLKLVKENPGYCYPMMGLHPCSVSPDFESHLTQMRLLFANESFVAVGECGLDLYWDKSTLDLQKKALAIQLHWAGELELPVVLHTRNAMRETVDVIKKENVSGLRGVFHCYSENFELAEEILELGFYFGIGGVLTYKNSGLAEAVKQLPLDRIILETDAPYLAPVPFRGKRNEPAYVWHVAKMLSEILDKSMAEVADITTENANRLFFSKK